MPKKKRAAQFRLELKEILIELLEACTHHILASRSIYPQSVFTKRLFGPTVCGVPIMVSEHADINNFITEGLSGFKDAIFNPISSNLIHQIDVVIIEIKDDGEERIIETYIFQFEFPQPSSSSAEDNLFLHEKDRFDMEQNVRALLLCLTSRMAELGPVNLKTKDSAEPNHSFNFRLHTSRQGAQVLADDLRWCKIPSHPNIFNHSVNSSSSILEDKDTQSGFSICDMVNKKSLQLEKLQNSEKRENTKIKKDKNLKNLNRNARKLLVEKMEQDLDLDMSDINSASVLVPVYQFDIPFKLKLLIEHSED